MQAQQPAPILLVDDEQPLLDALVRTHRRNFQFVTATGPMQALEILGGPTRFGVVVSDCNMPVMDGITLLDKVRQISPDTVRVMLTGNADMQTAIGAVNRGRIFRFLTKPCSPEDFSACLEAALEQYRLRNAERLLLEQTVRGGVRVLTDVLSLVNPQAFGRATRVQTYVRQIVKALKLDQAWQYETAALLSQIGLVAIPFDIIDRVASGRELGPEHVRMLESHPQVGGKLIERIPRLEPIARMISHQRNSFTPKAGAQPAASGDAIPIGGRILCAALDFEELLTLGATREQALDAMQQRAGRYDPQILGLLKDVEIPGHGSEVRMVSARELRVGMVLDQDIFNSSKILIVPKGNEINAGTLARLKNYAELGTIPALIRVRMGTSEAAGPAENAA